MKNLIRNITLAAPTVALLALFATRRSEAYPGDVFVAGAPLKGPTVHKAADIPNGSYAVSPQTGAATYSFPIPVPPGRSGMEPHLALVYSSQNPLRGGIAAGWEMPIPSIEVDTSEGILAGRSYKSTLPGGGHLVEVDEPLPDGRLPGVTYYRVQNGDSDYVRYEHHSFSPVRAGFWKALHPDGTVFVFGFDPSSRDEPIIDGTVREGRWMLTAATDPTGNEISYSYEKVVGQSHNGTTSSDVDISLAAIEYGENRKDANDVASHARIEFTWWSGLFVCPDSYVPKGAEFTWRNGFVTYRGARRLERIDIKSRTNAAPGTLFTTRHQIRLQYDASANTCTEPRAPLRLLSSITQTAWDANGVSQDPPAITFTYGTAGRTLARTTDVGARGYLTSLSETSRHLVPDPFVNPVTAETGQPGVVSMLDDVDGDGFVDFLALTDRHERSCDMTTAYNTAGQWGAAVAATWPRRLWENGDSSPNTDVRREFCNLAYQLDRRTIHPDDPDQVCPSMTSNYSSYHLIDLDGDKVPELVSALDYKPGSYDPSRDGRAEPVCGTSSPACLQAIGSTERTACAITPQWILPTADNPPGPNQPGGCLCAFDKCPGASCINNEGSCTEGQCGECYDCDPGLAGDASSYRFESDESGIEQWKTGYLSGRVGNEQATGILRGYHPGCRYQAESACQGRFIWRISHFNPATKTWGSPEVRFAPVPLESLRGTGSAGEGETMGSFQGLVDIDGDHCIDALYVSPRFLNGVTDHIQVFRGGCDGRFYGQASSNGTPDEFGTPYLWRLPPEQDSLAYSTAGSWPIGPGNIPRERAMSAVRAMRDINGDGLPDYVVGGGATFPGTASNGIKVYYNTGTGFEQTATVLAPGVADGVADEDLVHSISAERQVLTRQDAIHNDIYLGWSASTLREFDIDSDGLADIAQLPAPRWDYQNFNPWNPTTTGAVLPQTVWMHINVGDRFIRIPASPQTNQWWTGLAHITSFDRDRTYVKTDVADFNGDGLPDLVGEEPTGACNSDDPTGCKSNGYVYRDLADASGQGVRLLRTIDNGRGATIRFDYGSTAERTGPDPLVTMNDGRLPHPLWVVRTMTVGSGKTAGGPSAPPAAPAIYDYRYKTPVFSTDPQGQWGFRGFKGTVVTEPANAAGQHRRVNYRYNYELDYAGRPYQTTVRVDDGAILSTERFVWSEADLFGTDPRTALPRVRAFHPISTREYMCAGAGAETDDDCMATGTLKQTTRRFVPVLPDALSYSGLSLPLDVANGGGVVAPNAGTTPIRWVQRGERLTDTTDDVEAKLGDRGWVFGEKVLYSQDRYQVLPTDVRKLEATGAGWSGYRLVGRSQTLYDAANLGLPIESRAWYGDADGSYAATTRTFDSYGNLTSVHEPSGLVTNTTYDVPFALHPRTVRPVLAGAGAPNLTVTYTHDIHTGQVTRQEGPVQPGIATPPVVETTYDGQGRVTKVRRSFDSGVSLVTDDAKIVQYFDSESPQRVHVDERLNRTSNTWVRRDSTYDGLGRPLDESILFTGGPATTSYAYDPAGNLVSFSVPSPTGTGSATYSYEHDVLGRVTRANQPGNPGYWTFEYVGTQVVRRQVTPDESPGEHVILDSDAYGRLTRVTEVRSPDPNAVWTYRYDGNDNMDRIVDGDDIVTTMAHDLLGHRTSVTRTDTGGTARTWRYGYDLAGNLVSETMPYNGDPVTEEAKHVSTWTYDELGRVKSHRTASRGFTLTQTARYFPKSTGPDAILTTYTYDQSAHGAGLGHLTHVELPFGAIDYDYTVEGWVSDEDRQFSVAPEGVALGDQRTYSITYDALGNPLRVTHPDGGTITRVVYDERGLPDTLQRVNVSTSTVLARLARNVAGVPTTRYSAYNQGQSWTYDPLGRVTSHAIRSCTAGPVSNVASKTCATSGTTVAGETIGYYDGGDVSTIQDPYTGSTFAYTFDSQHQLRTASSDTNLYDGVFTYTPGGQVLTAEVTSPRAEANARDVTHAYQPGGGNVGAADPAAVRRLTSGGSTIGSFDYDPAGNLVHKTWDPAGPTNETYDFVYDGDNQLREAVSGGAQGPREVYYYDQNGQRMLAYSTANGGDPARLRLWFGQTEIEYPAVAPLVPNRTDVFASLGAMPVARIHRAGGTEQTTLLYSGVLGSLLAAVGTTADNSPNHGVAARYSYGPFGEQLAGPTSDDTDYHRLFNGKEHDSFTSLSYYGYRFYDRLTLTWTQADPLYRFVPDLAWDEPRRANLYSFSLNNPLRYYDPDGRSTCTANGQKKWWTCSDADRERAGAKKAISDAVKNRKAQKAKEKAAMRAAMEADMALYMATHEEYDFYNSIIGNITFAGMQLSLSSAYPGGGAPGESAAAEAGEAEVMALAADEAATAASIEGGASSGVAAAVAVKTVRKAPIVGGGAALSNISRDEAGRIQNAANRLRTSITLVGSRAGGTAEPAYSDWDYVINASSRVRHSAASSLPGATTLERIPSTVDIHAGPVDTSKPYITFVPE